MPYLLQAASAAGVLVMIAAMVLCLKQPAPRGRWLWLAFVLLGYAYLSLHPVAGSYQLKSVHIAFLAAGRMEQLTGSPEDVGVVVPFGALVFLALRRSLLRRKGA